MRPPPLPVGIALAALGLCVALVTTIAAFVVQGRFHARASNVTVPASVELGVEPGVRIGIAREMMGAHVTVNRPLLPLPTDLSITVTDLATGEAVAVEPFEWRVTQQVFNLSQERRTFAAFMAPPAPPDAPDARVRLDVRGGFAHDQVYAVGPTPDLLNARYGWMFFAGTGLGGVLVLIGAACCVLRVSQPSAPVSLDPHGP